MTIEEVIHVCGIYCDRHREMYIVEGWLLPVNKKFCEVIHDG